MSSTDEAIGETFEWRGQMFTIADAQHDESDLGEHWHLTVVPMSERRAELDPA